MTFVKLSRKHLIIPGYFAEHDSFPSQLFGWDCVLPGRVMSRLAVVCGGSRGIGEAVARLLAERGCRVAVVSRNQEAAEAAVAALHGGV